MKQEQQENFIKSRLILLAGKMLGFANIWSLIASVFLVLKLITNEQWILILSITLGGRILTKNVAITKNGSNDNKGD